jgi:NAD+ kinase
MKTEIKNILIVANSSKKDVSGVLEQIEAYFISKRLNFKIFTYNEVISEELLSVAELAFSLGGDGTLLRCARIFSEYGIPILGVNLGDFGFMTEISKNEWIESFEKFVSGKLGISERIMVNVRLMRKGMTIREINGLNEAVIGADGIARIVSLKIHLGSTYVGRYKADGAIVATPTGSTAYSMAAEGPILHPEMEAMILNPICPFSLSNRPLVVPGDETVTIEVEELQRTGLVLTIDGQETESLEPLDRVVIRKAEKKCRIINSDKRNFYEVLRAKLNWSGEPNA